MFRIAFGIVVVIIFWLIGFVVFTRPAPSTQIDFYIAPEVQEITLTDQNGKLIGKTGLKDNRVLVIRLTK